MQHIFTVEQEERAPKLLDSISMAIDAVLHLYDTAINERWKEFEDIADTLKALLRMVEHSSKPYQAVEPSVTLPLRSQAANLSLAAARSLCKTAREEGLSKLEYELIPILEEAYMEFYYTAYAAPDPERKKKYFEQDIYELASNKYINESIKTGQFPYELSIVITAYNKLDYTKQCIESLLRNIPEGLNYELILFDNGSSDGTADYFRSLRPNKLFQSHINWGGGLAIARITEGKYSLGICNDVLICENAIANMLSCIRSDERIARIVPCTPNVSNLQNFPSEIPPDYKDYEGLQSFAKQNNILDPRRWEDRTRLCDPLALLDSRAAISREGVCFNGYLGSFNAFPDDRLSLLLRRRGLRQILQKDAYCFHYGSVTLRDELKTQPDIYTEGRKQFKKNFGIDPWGTGMCFNSCFLKRRVGDETGQADVLGINCGQGSNSLKIKMQLREYCPSAECILLNVTDNPGFFPDLRGISDEAQFIQRVEDFNDFLQKRSFRYVVWDDPFLMNDSFQNIIQQVMEHIQPGGTIFIRESGQCAAWIRDCSAENLGEGWFQICREGSVSR